MKKSEREKVNIDRPLPHSGSLEFTRLRSIKISRRFDTDMAKIAEKAVPYLRHTLVEFESPDIGLDDKFWQSLKVQFDQLPLLEYTITS